MRTTGGVGDLGGISALSDPEACRLALRNKKSEKRKRRSNIIVAQNRYSHDNNLNSSACVMIDFRFILSISANFRIVLSLALKRVSRTVSRQVCTSGSVQLNPAGPNRLL